MQTFTGVESAHLTHPTVLTIGNFDGVHRGHQALLNKLGQTAQSIGFPHAMTAIVTFEPHPLKVLRPELPLNLLTTPHERLQIAAGFGLDIGVIQPFTRALAALEARDFLSLLKKHLGMVALVVGPDFALGRNRNGDIVALGALSDALDFRLVVQEHITCGERSVRSHTVRQFLTGGDVAEAAVLLGRPYHMTGIVVRGDQRGRQFGIPTANLSVPDEKLWPADGVYVTRSWTMDASAPRAYASVTNIGFRPTVNGRSRRVETHLLNFPTPSESDDLYGQQLCIEFIDRLRGEQRFSGPEELINQIHRDIELARLKLDSLPLPGDAFFMTPLAGPVSAD